MMIFGKELAGADVLHVGIVFIEVGPGVLGTAERVWV